MNQPNPETFMQLFSSHHRRLYGFVRSLVGNPEDAEDIVNQTVMVMWRKFETYESDTNFAAWALQIARLEVMNFRRRTTPQQRLFDDELFDQLADEALVVNNTLPDARLDALRECLKKLPEDSRRLIGMFYEQEMPVVKIAAAIDRSDKTIYRLIANIHQVLLACVRRTMTEL